MTRRLATLFAILSLAGLAGCAGDPALDGEALDRSLIDGELDRAVWEAASPGCEDVDPTGMTLAACEGEPLLGALVDAAGRVACVDAMSVLIDEVVAVRMLRPASADPSPQPSHPGMGDEGDDAAGRVVGTEDPNGDAFRPATGGVVRADPTPTPISEPLREDPTPTPVVEPRDQWDPTPTPVMPE